MNAQPLPAMKPRPELVLHQSFVVAVLNTGELEQYGFEWHDNGEEPPTYLLLRNEDGGEHIYPLNGDQRKQVVAMLSSGIIVARRPPE